MAETIFGLIAAPIVGGLLMWAMYQAIKFFSGGIKIPYIYFVLFVVANMALSPILRTLVGLIGINPAGNVIVTFILAGAASGLGYRAIRLWINGIEIPLKYFYLFQILQILSGLGLAILFWTFGFTS